MIAVSHPGKHGDALYALPTIRALCQRHHCPADFFTSDYCEPLHSLFMAQTCIHDFIVLDEQDGYQVERMDMGCQPWAMPIGSYINVVKDDEYYKPYEAIYQLGFRGIPDIAIPDYIAREAGVVPAPIFYETPERFITGKYGYPQEYIVIAPRGETSYTPFFRDLIEKSPLPVAVVGGPDDFMPFIGLKNAMDYPMWDYLTTAQVIERSKAFVGLMSSQLVLANGFPIPRICPHDGVHWDLRHVVRSEYNHYPVNPSAEQVLEMIHHALLQND